MWSVQCNIGHSSAPAIGLPILRNLRLAAASSAWCDCFDGE